VVERYAVAEILNKMVDAVGHAPTMPYYATGFIQCKDRYRNQSQILDVAQVGNYCCDSFTARSNTFVVYEGIY
jgi:alpha-glucosidase (family GH31 glycosyl hydrolase)